MIIFLNGRCYLSTSKENHSRQRKWNTHRFLCSRGTLEGEKGASFNNTVVYSNTWITGSKAKVKNSSRTLKYIFEQHPPPQPVCLQKEKTRAWPDKNMTPSQFSPPQHPLTARNKVITRSFEGLNYLFLISPQCSLPWDGGLVFMWTETCTSFPWVRIMYLIPDTDFYHAFNC